MSYKCTFIKVNHNDREAKLRFAERNVNDFKIYKRKNIAADQNEKSILDAFYATFQLMVTQLKLHLDKITIQEVDFHQIKDQLIVVLECKSFEFFHHYIRYVVEDLLIDMLKLTYLKTARVFLNLSIHILDCIQKVNGKVTKQRVKSPQSASINENILFAENKYFGSLLYVSCQMMQKDSSWTEEQDAQEQIFEDLLKKLGVEDNYEDIPEMIKTTKQVKQFWIDSPTYSNNFYSTVWEILQDVFSQNWQIREIVRIRKRQVRQSIRLPGALSSESAWWSLFRIGCLPERWT